ncbi:ZYRO0D01364p [Zygosaccharomyces rouxii]|uniref:WD repeat-containing protein JIP5 n=1 Tax=Zygosaccharomyces rouxii (strain ATCC 2623 / CBS 732 / NBRC 1130 / NCYC 568 / NRRL Y-229) TaxID=559307 RepID=C5DUT9_ZYGRC|nr:uncharacterized protein ZYRO0D01364g [Zygosaccharomyces rouxii]KAH9200474.1 WD40-repeat-containing domain protein [Zygosaccharomyces rouxii]CAR27558.1 ZYRO0D01364p [Zygosaccharomyces rouxii]
MAKKKENAGVAINPDSLPLLELRYGEPLFQMACHPSRPLIYSGLATGHLYCHEYDASILDKLLQERKSQGKEINSKPWLQLDAESADVSGIRIVWKTRRHRGSVRCLCLDAEGEYVYSVGTDNILKKASAENGKVLKKVDLQGHGSKFTKLVHSGTHPYLLLGDEEGNVLVLDNDTLKLKNKIIKIHGGDAINDIFQFTKRSVHKYISLGQTTLAYWDSRVSNEDDTEDTPEEKRKVLVSDDQEDEILCGTFVDPESGDTVVCGMGEGVLTVWKPEKNDLEDQVNRIKVSKGESIDAVVPTLRDDNCVWCGVSNGRLYKVDTKRGQVVEVREHSEMDEVGFLDLDYEYRLVSGGMDSILIWNTDTEQNDEVESEGGSASSDSDSDSDSDANDSDADGSDANDSEANDSDAGGSDSDANGGDSDDSDSGGKESGKVGLSREELIAELDKEIEENEQEKDNGDKQEEDKKISNKRKRKEKLKKNKRPDNGIAKFEGL